MNQDPRIQIMKEDLRLREQEQVANVQNDQQRNVLKAEEIRLKESEQRNQDEIDIMKINTDKEIAMQKMAVDASTKTRNIRSQEVRDASRAKSNERIANKRETSKKKG
jgi:tRNA G10  N-methylase Trm11